MFLVKMLCILMENISLGLFLKFVYFKSNRIELIYRVQKIPRYRNLHVEKLGLQQKFFH